MEVKYGYNSLPLGLGKSQEWEAISAIGVVVTDIGVRNVLNFQIIRDQALIMVVQDTEVMVLQVVGEGALEVVEEDL